MSGGAEAIIDFPFRSRCALSIPRRKLSALIISRHGTIYILIIHHVFPTFMGPGNEFFKSLWPFLLRRAKTHLDAWWKLIFSIFFFSHVLIVRLRTIKQRIKGIRFSWLVNNGCVFLFIFGWVYFFTFTCRIRRALVPIHTQCCWIWGWSIVICGAVTAYWFLASN
jgi:hypothetical protein